MERDIDRTARIRAYNKEAAKYSADPDADPNRTRISMSEIATASVVGPDVQGVAPPAEATSLIEQTDMTSHTDQNSGILEESVIQRSDI